MTSIVHNPVPRIAPIQEEVAAFYEVSVADLSSPGRTERVVLPRHVAMYLCRKLTRYSLQEIAQAFGGRDHGTVSNAVSQVCRRMTTDGETRREVDHLFAKVGLSLQRQFPHSAGHPVPAGIL